MEKKNGLLKLIPAFRSDRSNDPSQLSSKDKKYLLQVEKALQTFELLDEWADYIAFLSRLHKSLLLPQEAKLNHSVNWIPRSMEVSNKLSLCLSPKLPNGVHQKTLSLYESIFTALTIDTFNNEIYVWLPGLLPVLSFGSMQVKSQVIQMFKTHLLPYINAKNIRVVSKPLILCFLAGLDDENSESFPQVFELMDSLKVKLDDDSHFWKSFFLALISNPEKRLGALYYFNKRLPVFHSYKLENGDVKYSDEAKACIEPSPGLLIRAFASSINTETIFNPANDIIVIRGFFDLMLSHLPLNSDILTSFPRDKDILMKAGINILLKKDMSLNRRFWNWLLGPDTEVDATTARTKYFESYGLETLTEVLLQSINSVTIGKQIDSFKMSLSLIIDKWEISHLIMPKIVLPILTNTFNRSNEESPLYNDLLSACQDFFNGVETASIWKLIIGLIKDSNWKLLEFLLNNFDLNEEDMKVDHSPLGLVVLLSHYSDDPSWLNAASVLLDLISPKGLETGATVADPLDLTEKILEYYDRVIEEDESIAPPFTKSELSFLLYNLFKKVVINHLESGISSKLCEFFVKLINILPIDEKVDYKDQDIISLIYSLPQTTSETSEEEKDKNLFTAFGVSKLFNLMAKDLLVSEKTKIIKIISTNLWPSLVSSDPTKHQVEVVKCFHDLMTNSSPYYIEPAISRLLFESKPHERIRAMISLWSLPNSNELDSVLEKPLNLILDGLLNDNSLHKVSVNEFIRTILKNGHSNRLLKMMTNSLLDYDLLHLSKEKVETNDDLAGFSYHLKTILNVINSNNKNLKDAFNNEFAVMDNSVKLKIIKSNEWDISTYKSLIFYIIEKFLSLKVDDSVLQDNFVLQDYCNSVDHCLQIFSILVSGNEGDFSEKFHRMIDNCFYYMSFTEIPYEVELIQGQYLRCIFHLLKISEDTRINLNLLHIEDEGREPLLIKFIITGIKKTQTSMLLGQWMALLTRSLYLFNDSIFSVLSFLNSALLERIDQHFSKLVKGQDIEHLVDLEASINELIGGVEDLLSISHSYLLTSRIRNKGASASGNGESFLGNVIQGVFLIESPAIRTTEQNRLYSVLIAFQDAVKIGFKIWDWTDSKIKPQNYMDYKSDKSLIYLGNKLKFRSKKLLETLMDLERQEVIENLINIDRTFRSSTKLLNLLDGGRSQITLPHILDSILSRSYPSLVQESKKSHLNVQVGEKDISKFLVCYFDLIDTDSVTEIWNTTIQFFKDVLAHFNHFKPLIPNFLRVICKLSLRLNSSKFGDDKKYKKELSDIFIKLLGLSVSGKRILFGSDAIIENEENSEDEIDDVTAPQGLQEELIDSISETIQNFEDIIQDQEKISGCVSIIITNLIVPQTKNKKIGEISVRVLALFKTIGQYHPTKSWRSLVNDLFMDPAFFQIPTSKIETWKSIISLWISVEQDKFKELLQKITASSGGGPGALFMFNEKLEIQNKVLTLKRISYLILVQEKDFFLSSLDALFERIEESLTQASIPMTFRTHLSVLFRAITIKFNELYLIPRWIVMGQELVAIFDSLIGKSMKELSFLNEEELQSVLYGCKLLDQLLILDVDEFNLQEWLFVNGTFEIDSDMDEYLISIIDRLSKENDLTILKESPVKMNELIKDNKKVPLLHGITSIPSIASLRNFFESLSYLNFERVYGLYPVDFEACQADILDDLFN